MDSRHTPPRADRAPDWVMGSFTMTGSAVSRHGAQVLMGLARADCQARALSFHPGAFATQSLGQVETDPKIRAGCGVVYLRGVLRLPKGRRRWAIWGMRFWRLASLVRTTDQVIVLPDPARRAVVNRAAALALVLATRRVRGLSTPRSMTEPDQILAQLGAPAAPPAAEAEDAAFTHIRRLRPTAELKFTPSHLARALKGPQAAQLSASERADIGALARQAGDLPAWVIESHRRARLTAPPGPQAPTALRHALSALPEAPGLTRMAHHLRLLRAKRRKWESWVPAPSCTAPGLTPQAARILAHLAGGSSPADQRAMAPLLTRLCAHRDASQPGLSRLDFMLVVAGRPNVPTLDALHRPWASVDLAAPLAPLVAPPPAPGGIVVAGIAGGLTGLSANLHMTSAALTGLGLAHSRLPLDPGTQGFTTDARPGAAAGNAVIWHLNADRLPMEMLRHRALLDHHQIGFLLWELDRLPPAHALALDMLDEIWVPSVFLTRLYQKSFARKVIYMRKGIALPAPRAHGWPQRRDGVTRFVTCYDARSSLARKNPLAAVRAFQAAFEGRVDVELILKSTTARGPGWGDPEGQAAALTEAAAQDPRIVPLAADLAFPDLVGLIASADALVSPHRAEGFGYMPAYALALGVPVIATDHGGTRDFCTRATSDPIPFDRVPVPPNAAILRTPGARWADVDTGAMAQAMHALTADPAPARARAARGQLLMQADYSMAAQARRMAARLAELGLMAPPETAVMTAAE